MSSTNPPDGWSVVMGTWGTDMNIFSTPEPVSGDVCIGFTGAGQVGLKSDNFPVLGGRTYRFDTQVRTEHIANSFGSAIWWLDSSESLISPDILFSGTVGSINTWLSKGAYVLAPTSARFAMVLIGTTSTSPGTYAYFDNALVSLAKVWFSAYRGGSVQSVNASTSTKVQINAVTGDPSGVFDPSSNHRFVAPHYGVWSFAGSVEWDDDLGDQATYYTYIIKNGSVELGKIEQTVSGSQAPTQQVATGPVELNQGDYIELFTRHSSSSGARNIRYNQNSTWLRGHEL